MASLALTGLPAPNRPSRISHAAELADPSELSHCGRSTRVRLVGQPRPAVTASTPHVRLDELDGLDGLDGLMTQLANGDRSAFTPVFERLWPVVLRFCTRLVRHEADAADAAQNAMQKILTRASDYDPNRPALPWAFAIASWECRTILRRRQRQRELPTPDVPPVASELETDVSVLQRELLDAAHEAMGTLSALDRQTLTEAFFEEAPRAVSPTVRKRKQRALERLRAAFRRIYGLD